MKKRLKFVVNPKSGIGSKEDFPQLLERNLDAEIFEYDIHYTEYRGHAKKIAKAAADEAYDLVCAVGGDGSVHEVGTALIGTNTALGIIPMGSGNGLARHLKIPLQVEKAIRSLNHCEIIRMDTGLVNDKPFLGIGGYGFDALIAQKFDKYHTRGFWGYTRLTIREYLSYKPIKIDIRLEEEEREEEVVLCTIANSSEFGNGFTVSPDSDVSDGIFELCILHPFPKWKAPWVIYNFFKRKGHLLPYAEIIPFKKARITLHEQMAHYDGEPVSVRKELNVQIKPESLHVIVGEAYSVNG
ncbi:MAG: YegS/Rv2252/BmrU family lipid kinase [Bacteroidetes bacterium]|nr:MAG: YegS/Rv2252/BmrU family lipid kinase [Bacteroidota bacterium]